MFAGAHETEIANEFFCEDAMQLHTPGENLQSGDFIREEEVWDAETFEIVQRI